jgi:transcriptional regulator
MILTRREKERRILDLAEQGYKIRQIAQDTHTSFRDISVILKKESQQKELEQIHSERTSISTQAYRLFSKGKNVLQVVFALQLEADEAIKYFEDITT